MEVSEKFGEIFTKVNVLSHVYLAKAIFPSMIENGGGGFLITASAAGLLTHPTAVPYSVTKQAAVALAENFAIEFGDQGIYVSCLCPQGVKTAMISCKDGEPENFLMAEAISPEECADAVVEALEKETFLILPHSEVGEYIVNKAENYDRWLHSLRKIRTAVLDERKKFTNKGKEKVMKIGIIGAGNIGGTVAKLFAEAGHEIAIANSRGPETLSDLINEIGENAKAVTVEEAVDFGEIVFVSIPFGKYKELPADKFEGKIVIDSNNYYPDRDGNFEDIDNNKITSSELLAEHLKGSTIVKAFNTIWSEHLKSQENKDLPNEERRVIFVCGDDEEGKAKVSAMIEEIGFGAYDTGSLSEGGKTQAVGSAIYNRDLTVAEVDAVLQSSY